MTGKFDPSKFPDESLRQFAESDSAEQVSALVELEAPQPRIVMGNRPAWGGPPRPIAIEGDQESAAEEMDRLEFQLTEILTSRPVRLEAGQVFVVDATPGQLREIAHMPCVGKIRPNRTHRVP